MAESVRRCDGVLLTGGEDVNPELYAKKLPAKLQKTVTKDPGERDLRELILVDEIFRQRKPVLGICRGHQIMNVALGGMGEDCLHLNIWTPATGRGDKRAVLFELVTEATTETFTSERRREHSAYR